MKATSGFVISTAYLGLLAYESLMNKMKLLVSKFSITRRKKDSNSGGRKRQVLIEISRNLEFSNMV